MYIMRYTDKTYLYNNMQVLFVDIASEGSNMRSLAQH